MLLHLIVEGLTDQEVLHSLQFVFSTYCTMSAQKAPYPLIHNIGSSAASKVSPSYINLKQTCSDMFGFPNCFFSKIKKSTHCPILLSLKI
jgi:hypothetical protein